jgi:iron-sulfur cluster assembly accessory protein
MTATGNISVTDRAANRIRDVLAAEPNAKALRVAVLGGGCSGFSYEFSVAQAVEPDDLVIEKLGARVAIDPISIPYMDGSEIDYVDNLMGAAFKIANPNAIASCGCGTSFSI